MRGSQEARQQAEQCSALRKKAAENRALLRAAGAPAVNQAHQGEDLLNQAAVRAQAAANQALPSRAAVRAAHQNRHPYFHQ